MDPVNTARIREPDIAASTGDGGARRVTLSGAWDIRALEQSGRRLSRRLHAHMREGHAAWDLSAVQRLDHVGALTIWRAWGRGRPDEVVILPEHELFFSHLDATAPPRQGWAFDLLAPVVKLGGNFLATLEHLRGMVALLGQLALDATGVAANPRRGPWREFSASLYRTGAQALGITALVGFLIGIVLCYLSAEQLRTFGANIYVINIVGIGVIRELGPVLAATIVAGRSGSAITAQLGVMRVTEELDAMTVMGIPYTQRLVLPKVLALAVAMPLLILWSDAIALIGAMLAAKAQLDIGFSTFIRTLPTAVPVANYWLGLGKGVVFGVLIALTASHFGLRIRPNTESLGQGTTKSVVTAITIVLIVDAIFAVAFSSVGLELRI